ncbi:MAG: hypothetical protein H0V44_15115 [Planctomycetes bacterium]|nr:hypothetical protein [Planctomycetota bacterium]
MGRWQILLVALAPAAVIATLFIALMSWREHAALEAARSDLQVAQQQRDEMQRLGATLSEARKSTKQWQERWKQDTDRLMKDLEQTAEDLKAARAEIAQAITNLADRELQIKALEAKAVEAKARETSENQPKK